MSDQPAYTIAVRALCEFTAKRGDLDLRFTPSPTAQQGMAGHKLVTARRGKDYQAELSLADTYGPLRVRGRADGYDPGLNQLEEIKTYRGKPGGKLGGKLGAIPDNHRHLHWAQARIYGWLCCRALDLQEIRVALVYFNIASEEETVFTKLHSADALREHFREHCARFLDWAQQQLDHRAKLDVALAEMVFPHASLHPGQRELATAIYRCALHVRRLLPAWWRVEIVRHTEASAPSSPAAAPASALL